MLLADSILEPYIFTLINLTYPESLSHISSILILSFPIWEDQNIEKGGIEKKGKRTGLIFLNNWAFLLWSW